MTNYFNKILILTIAFFLVGFSSAKAAEEESELNMKEFILDHIADHYDWHITNIGETELVIPLPIIVYSEQSGFNVFLSSALHEGHSHNGLYLATEGEYVGKVVEKNAAGEEVRPIDISITKNVIGLFFSCFLLITVVLAAAKWHKKQDKDGVYEAPKGFVGMMEMFIMSVVDDIIKPSIGKDYRKYTPYLLTAFFFIILNNLLGLIPIFPAGANVTGNIAVTFILAMFTFVIVNVNGTKAYYKEIFWPDVPIFLKAPIPLMPLIEFVGVFTKPFSLMVRLFANILAGHSIVLGLTCLIFVTVSLGAAMNGVMTGVSVILSAFILLVEVLVAYIQAYVFTMLSAVYIGMARAEHH